MDLKSILDHAPRVLVADDDRSIRDLLQSYLEASGCRVLTAADGQTALDIAQKQVVDLVLLDVQMPRMNGLEVCRKLKVGEFTRLIPVMIVTAHDTDPERLEAIDAGTDEFLGKPFNSTLLLTRARSLLRLRALHLELENRNALLHRALRRYVSQDVADVILSEPERYMRLGGETRPVTVLFADLKGFMRYTEHHSATEVVECLNQIFPLLTSVIFDHNGTFDKYIGDAVMAFYGAPVSGPDDARRAVETAVEMQRRFAEWIAEKPKTGGELALSIGLHTGEAIVGNIGSERVMDYTVVGDTVNIARRLQESAEAGQVLLSDATYQTAGKPPVKRLGEQRLPGRSEPVTVYALDVK
jgi:class 3 adenylate cyclase